MSCPFCKNNKISKNLRVFSKVLNKVVYYSLCKRCNSINQEDIPSIEEIKKYYESYIEIKKEMNPGYLTDNALKPFFDERDKTLNEIGFDINSVKNTTNLELGCANGHFLKYLKKKGALDVTGIDISQQLIDTINIEGVKLLVGDFSLIKDNTIDNLFMFNVLEHIDDIEKT
ncbi:MAG TPA: class I SAM-dependent methyltransferase, partial [Spirochaetota bacterium]|nr:class I SAM-dependent methyltransferase [Spirochaetota bacterium]